MDSPNRVRSASHMADRRSDASRRSYRNAVAAGRSHSRNQQRPVQNRSGAESDDMGRRQNESRQTDCRSGGRRTEPRDGCGFPYARRSRGQSIFRHSAPRRAGSANPPHDRVAAQQPRKSAVASTERRRHADRCRRGRGGTSYRRSAAHSNRSLPRKLLSDARNLHWKGIGRAAAYSAGYRAAGLL